MLHTGYRDPALGVCSAISDTSMSFVCPTGYQAPVLGACSAISTTDRTCPYGYQDPALDLCSAKSILPDCGGNDEQAGLCYPPCPAGTQGVGPICVPSCPSANSVPCGFGCADTVEHCAFIIATQTADVIGLFFSILFPEAAPAISEVEQVVVESFPDIGKAAKSADAGVAVGDGAAGVSSGVMRFVSVLDDDAPAIDSAINDLNNAIKNLNQALTAEELAALQAKITAIGGKLVLYSRYAAVLRDSYHLISDSITAILASGFTVEGLIQALGTVAGLANVITLLAQGNGPLAIAFQAIATALAFVYPICGSDQYNTWGETQTQIDAQNFCSAAQALGTP